KSTAGPGTISRSLYAHIPHSSITGIYIGNPVFAQVQIPSLLLLLLLLKVDDDADNSPSPSPQTYPSK
ncbi:hypothetical protein LTS18_004515, partial [Coniosporium uncinatum]